MDVNEITIFRWARQDPPFLMWRRRKNRRSYWYTNDALIHAWELRRCKRDAPAIRDTRKRQTAKKA